MSVEKAFSRSSRNYESRGFIQNQVAKNLVGRVKERPKHILDLGCGSGFIYKNIDWEFDKFIGVDFSKEMLKLHPKFKTELIFENFDALKFPKSDTLISSSSLQWSSNLKELLEKISELEIPTYLSLFTSKTFSEVHKYFQTSSPIYSLNEILSFANGFQYEVENFEIEFSNSREVLKYIKESGVSGGGLSISPNQIRNFISEDVIQNITLEIVYLWRD
jgi:malonyl-CoA O-methyltransferase